MFIKFIFFGGGGGGCRAWQPPPPFGCACGRVGRYVV